MSDSPPHAAALGPSASLAVNVPLTEHESRSVAQWREYARRYRLAIRRLLGIRLQLKLAIAINIPPQPLPSPSSSRYTPPQSPCPGQTPPIPLLPLPSHPPSPTTPLAAQNLQAAAPDVALSQMALRHLLDVEDLSRVLISCDKMLNFEAPSGNVCDNAVVLLPTGPPLATTTENDIAAAQPVQSPTNLSPARVTSDPPTAQSAVLPEDGFKVVQMLNICLPRSLYITNLSQSATGLALCRIAEVALGRPSGIPDSSFPRGPGDDELEGLSELFTFLRQDILGFDDLRVSIDDIRQNRLDKIATILECLLNYEAERRSRSATISPKSSTISAEHEELVKWINSHVPDSLHVNNLEWSLHTGHALFRLAEAIVGVSGGVPDSSFTCNPYDNMFEGLFKLFGFLVDNGVETGDVSLLDIHLGRPGKAIQIVNSLKTLEESRLTGAKSVGVGAASRTRPNVV